MISKRASSGTRLSTVMPASMSLPGWMRTSETTPSTGALMSLSSTCERACSRALLISVSRARAPWSVGSSSTLTSCWSYSRDRRSSSASSPWKRARTCPDWTRWPGCASTAETVPVSRAVSSRRPWTRTIPIPLAYSSTVPTIE